MKKIDQKIYAFPKKDNYLIKWIIIIILLILTIFGLKSYVKSVYQKEITKSNQQLEQIKKDFRQNVKNSNKSADRLVLLGKKMLENKQAEYAAIVLEEASAKDPKYRDAALYTGYAYLRLAEETLNPKSEILNNTQIQNSNDKNKTIEQFNSLAINYLVKARDIDPLNATTHQLLAIAYKNIGDEQQSALAAEKAQAFATNNTNEQN